ncbi:MAG TPA: YdeI/OmpD-associated family protein [Candidatus Limnocylindria bacterium]|nr:YdeI/OmpD-associated family protein [Candidatus Limnocylindria bacterium]
MADPQVTIFPSAADFRRWLEENHATAGELWVGYYKKGSGKSSMIYAEAVDEALCYGWIDGLTRSFGAYYANRFTPRRRGSNWSAVNIAKIAELKRQGRLQPAGLRAFEARDPRRDAVYSYERKAELPADMEHRLRANDGAWAGWQAETPSYRRGAVGWVLEAKREETRERRLAELIADSAAGRRIKPYRYFDQPRARRET